MKKVIGFYRSCDLLTMLSVVFSITGMILSINGLPIYAVCCLIGSGICDAFDGALARMRKNTPEESCYGAELDSLADVICFGVTPVVITLTNFNYILLNIVCVFYCLAGVIRLAYYNMLAIKGKGDSGYFVGIPITTISIIYPILYFIYYFGKFTNFEYVFLIFFLLVGLSYIIPIKVKKLTNNLKLTLSIGGILAVLVIISYIF